MLKAWCPFTEVTKNNVFPHIEIIHCIGGTLTYHIIYNEYISLTKILGMSGTVMLLSISLSICIYRLYSAHYESKYSVAERVNHSLVKSKSTNIKMSIHSKPSVFIEHDECPLAPKPTVTEALNSKSNMIQNIIETCENSQVSQDVEENLINVQNNSEQAINGNIIIDTLASFCIDAEIGSVYAGSSFSLYEIQVPPGVKVQKIKQLSDTLALRLKMESVRIISPVKGTDSMGIEIPNKTNMCIPFFTCLNDCLQKDLSSNLKIPIIIGKNVYNDTIVEDMTDMPHLLIAGTTGSGKSVCINSILTSIISMTTPYETKLILIDPKMVELSIYNNCPHILCDIITQKKEAALAFRWINEEMEKRYAKLMDSSCRNIDSYNQKNLNDVMPRIVCIVDEFNDLMMAQSDCDANIEADIIKIAQKSRAVGIHLILATQRPSREVVTGLIKANFPSRIAFKVANRYDSQIILDEQGAELLCGNGDLFYAGPRNPNLIRAQGCFLDELDIISCIDEVTKNYGSPDKICNKFSEIYKEQDGIDLVGNFDDPLIERAAEIAKMSGQISATLLQRHLKIGYPRAAGIIDHLTRTGVISSPNNQRQREYQGGYPSEE
ncbi:MAG: DNA translocase FtsK [Chlamydiia bacterium]|nr:DNA translocase FtsK [Chlamydiia bacterium]